MVRYSIAVRGEPKDQEHEIRIHEEQIDFQNKEQLTEHYLCDINAAGEVPVIAPVDSKDTIPDSQEITKYLAGSHPSLIPISHEIQIKQLLSDLHAINFFALTFIGQPQIQENAKGFLQSQLKGDISEKYRKAIEHKIQRIDNNKLGALEADRVEKNERYAKGLAKKFEDLLRNSKTGWLLGFDNPSALDAHFIVFIARMLDIRRDDLITEKLKEYASKAMESAPWKEVMQGRTTLASVA